LSRLNRFSKILHRWKAHEISYKTHVLYTHYPPHLRHVATLPWETKNSCFLQMWKKRQTECIFHRLFVIYLQILIFLVFKIAMQFVVTFSVSLFFCLFSFTISLCPTLKKTLRQLMTYSWVKRTSRRPIGLSVRFHGRRVSIGRLYPRLFVRICIWNVSRGAVHRSWQTRTALLAWSALSFRFRSSCSLPLTLSSLQTKRCSRSLHLTIGRTTASKHPVTQGCAALPLSACCAVVQKVADFIEENSFVCLVCLNIWSILLVHKYTQHTQLHA